MANKDAKTSLSSPTEGQQSFGQTRPPVVAIMGHIDHGKSTLLDYIRKSNIVGAEAGGITQRLSAYEAEHVVEGVARRITFLDTPGHEAFQAMRARGASAADIVILVVAADDGVKEQTLEALKAITEAKVPFVVAINKIDKPNANIEAVKQGLAEREVFLEGYGGKVPFVAISAKAGTGIGELLDLVLLTADLEGVSGDETKNAEGVVIESHIDPKKGTSATLIVKDGILESGMFIVAGTSVAPTRIMENFLGVKVQEVRMGSPVRVVGFNTAPPVGAWFKAVRTKQEVEALAIHPAPPETIRRAAASKENVAIPMIIKADALGAIDAIMHEIQKRGNERVTAKIVATGIGDISENDVRLLGGGDVKGVVVGFNVKASSQVKELATRDGVAIGTFDIIYRIAEWLESEFEARTPKREIEQQIGLVRIIKTFSRTKEKQIIGGEVLEGVLTRAATVKILRRDAEIGRGKLVDLQQQKVRAEKVEAGNQFGAQVEARIDIAPGDRLEAFETVIV